MQEALCSENSNHSNETKTNFRFCREYSIRDENIAFLLVSFDFDHQTGFGVCEFLSRREFVSEEELFPSVSDPEVNGCQPTTVQDSADTDTTKGALAQISKAQETATQRFFQAKRRQALSGGEWEFSHSCAQ